MPVANFFNGEQDIQFVLNAQTTLNGVISIKNFYVDVSGSLIPRPDTNFLNSIILQENEEIIGEPELFKGLIFVPVKKSDDTLKLYRCAVTGGVITTVDTGLTIVNTVRFFKLATDNTFIFNPLTPANEEILMIFGLEELYYTLTNGATLTKYIVHDTTTASFKEPIDGDILQGRFWVLARGLRTADTSKLTLFASKGDVLDDFKSTAELSDSFSTTLVIPTKEETYSLTSFQTQLLLITSTGIRSIRSSNLDQDAITTENITQFLTGSLSCIDVNPLVLLSKFIIYGTTDGLHYKEIANLDRMSSSRESPDENVYFYKKGLSNATVLFESLTRPVFFSSLDNKLIASSFIQTPTTPAVFNYSTYREDDVNVKFLKYFADDGLIVKLDKRELVFETELQYMPLIGKNIFLKETENFNTLSLSSQDYSFSVALPSSVVFTKISLLVELNVSANFEAIKEYLNVYFRNTKNQNEKSDADEVTILKANLNIFFQDSKSTVLEFYLDNINLNEDTLGQLNLMQCFIKVNPSYNFLFQVFTLSFI